MLINNIAWLLRHLPVFAIGGRGDYRIRGIHVDDLARLCVELGARDDTLVVDAVGPQSLTFRELVDTVRAAVGSHAVIVPVPGRLLTVLSSALSLLLHDRLLTREEYQAMAHGLADSDAPATGTDQRRPTGSPNTDLTSAAATPTSSTDTSGQAR